MLNDSLDDDLLKEIRGSIQELQQLERDVEDRRGFYRKRLVGKDGVVQEEMVANL